MKKSFYALALSLCFLTTYTTQAQTTIVLQPNSTEGKDAAVWSGNGNGNYSLVTSNSIYTWTNGGLKVNKRSFIEFDYSEIPLGATITDARLSLYYNPTDTQESFEFHTGTNDFYIQRVISGWEENLITWDNQPATSTSNQVTVPTSTSETQDYLNIDVKEIVIDMNDPLNGNNGFMLRMVNEVSYYRGVILASSNHPDAALHPKLDVCWLNAVDAVDRNSAQEIPFEIFPNPNNGFFEFKFSDRIPSSFNVEILDITGRSIPNYDFQNNQIQLDVKGVYFVKISDENGNYSTRKIIVQ